MTTQLDEHPAQILTSAPERNESPGRRWTRIVATAAVAGLALGAGLIVAVVRTDRAGSPVGNAEQGDTPAPGVSGGGLPVHLQEFEARTTSGSSETPEEPQGSAYQIIQDEIDASLTAVATQGAEEPQGSVYQIIQDEIDASLARPDSASGE